MIRSMLNVPLACNLWEALLHEPILSLSSKERKLEVFVFLAARQNLARVWGQDFLNLAEAEQRSMGIRVHEKLTSLKRHPPVPQGLEPLD